QVSVCIPVDREHGRVMLVSSRSRPNEWILPKGGWESDESKERSAEREAWEEAGVLGQITRQVGVWIKPSKKHAPRIKSRFSVYELEVRETRDVWPEQS
ncbi:NUDIX hydrolase domain-like protein, partial [Thamnocephalis sphaerospora]